VGFVYALVDVFIRGFDNPAWQRWFVGENAGIFVTARALPVRGFRPPSPFSLLVVSRGGDLRCGCCFVAQARRGVSDSSVLSSLPANSFSRNRLASSIVHSASYRRQDRRRSERVTKRDGSYRFPSSTRPKCLCVSLHLLRPKSQGPRLPPPTSAGRTSMKTGGAISRPLFPSPSGAPRMAAFRKRS